MIIVEFGNRWDLTREQWRQLHVLEWLYDRADRYVGTDLAEIGRPYAREVNPAESLDATFRVLVPDTASALRLSPW